MNPLGSIIDNRPQVEWVRLCAHTTWLRYLSTQPSLSTQHNAIACLAAPQSFDRLVDVRKFEFFDLRLDLVEVGEIQHFCDRGGAAHWRAGHGTLSADE